MKFQYLFIYLEMQKSPYFPSPLRKDYTTKPLRNFVPILPAQSQKQPPKNQPSLISKKKDPPQKKQSSQKSIRYSDGLLVKMVKNNNQQSGLFFMNNYVCMIYNLQGQVPHGKSYIFYLSGVIMSLYYQNGVLNWIVAYSEKKFIGCYHYKRGYRQGQQYFYDFHDQMLVVSQYRRGNLQSIKNSKIGQFQKIIKNKQILDRVNELKSKDLMLVRKFPSLKKEDFIYYGQLDLKQQNPHGHGILLTNTELFIGNFNRGFLSGIGCIKFYNDDYYFGHFVTGVCEGYGSITDRTKTTYNFGQIQIPQQQFEAFIKLQSIPQIEVQWLKKYKNLQQFHQQFRNKYDFLRNQQQQEQNQQEKDESLQIQEPSLLNIDVQQSSIPKQQGEQLGDDYLQYSNSPLTSQKKNKQNSKNNNLDINSKIKIIPKLSLFQQMDLKIRKSQIDSEDRVIRDRKKQKQELQRQKNKILTERNQRQDIKMIRIKVPTQNQNISMNPKKNKNKMYQYQSAQYVQEQQQYKSKLPPKNQQSEQQQASIKKQKSNRTPNSPKYQHLRTQNLGLDKWYVSSQTNIMRPHETALKIKQDKNSNSNSNFKPNNMNFQKNPNNNINMGKIMKVSSDISEDYPEQFIENMITRQDNPYHRY